MDGEVTCLDAVILQDAVASRCINTTNGRVRDKKVNIYDGNKKLVFSWYNADYDNSGSIGPTDTPGIYAVIRGECEIDIGKVPWACKNGEVDVDGHYTCSNDCYTE